MNKFRIICTVIAIASLTHVAVWGVERSQISEKDRWNLQDLYPSDEAWREAKDKTISEFDRILQYEGRLASSASVLLACLQFDSRIEKDFSRLFSYASMKSDEDTRNSDYLAMKQEMMQHGTVYNSNRSFLEPEIIQMDEQTINNFIEQEPDLRVYKKYLFDILRMKAHRLSPKEEKILAEASLMASSPHSIFRIFTNAELPYPEIEISDGSTVKLNLAGYSRYRTLPDRSDREAVFNAFWTAINSFRGTLGQQLYSNLLSDIFYARARNYESSLESALDVNNIPTEVYLALINNVNHNLDSFHRYLELKKRMLNVDSLKYSDLYAPVVQDVDLQYTVEEAKDLVLEAVRVLGEDYSLVISEAFENRWIDFYPSEGKRSGAYSNGNAYDVHPYILMNFNGKFDDVSTLAHELGHSLHSYYANKAQPYPLADYSIFVAEVASTFNEALLINRVLSDVEDDDIRLSLLMNYLDQLKGTVFRQTQFAEFELRIHETAERGEPLTGDRFSQIYRDILKKHYGHDQGVCTIDDLYTVEWAYVPHFYYNFYVYQYATSFTASTALAEKVLNNEKGAIEKYIQFISSGDSEYPIALLKRAGVDMTSTEPFDKTIVAMNRTMDEIEKILDKRGK